MRRLALLSLLALAACAATPHWVNPNLPKDRLSGDYSACRRYANDQAGPPDTEPDDRAGPSALRAAERADAQKRLNAYVAICMEDKGYRPTD